MKKNICVITGTRAEYGLLRILMEKIKDDEDLSLQIIATGTHLSPEFGLTYHEIEKDGFHVDEKIEMLLSADTKTSVAKSMGIALMGFADAFHRLSPDMTVVLGDRYEIFAAASAAMILNIPIAHIHGGETTEGLIDEAIRHSITKMSYLHFASTEAYKKRILQLGESPERVFNVGALGIENIKTLCFLSEKELSEILGFSIEKGIALVTFHPVTLEENSSQNQVTELMSALSRFKDLNYVFTKANADMHGRIINRMIDDFVKGSEGKHHAFSSLGQLKYLSLMRHSAMVIGNSSSGIIETPSFGIPTINIGDRQRGRIQAKTVINCEPERKSIIKAIQKARNKEFLSSMNGIKNPYELKGTSDKILFEMKRCLFGNEINLKKTFYDL